MNPSSQRQLFFENAKMNYSRENKSEHCHLNSKILETNVQNSKNVRLNKDQWLGECLNDYLFKLCGTDQVVWIPKEILQQCSSDVHAFEACIDFKALYCCAKLSISNTIRMCLIDQHQVKGSQLMAFLVNPNPMG